MIYPCNHAVIAITKDKKLVAISTAAHWLNIQRWQETGEIMPYVVIDQASIPLNGFLYLVFRYESVAGTQYKTVVAKNPDDAVRRLKEQHQDVTGVTLFDLTKQLLDCYPDIQALPRPMGIVQGMMDALNMEPAATKRKWFKNLTEKYAKTEQKVG